MKRMTGGQALVAQLAREGIKDVFGVPGVQLDWAFDAIRTSNGAVRYIVPRHEQATSYMADGYARTGGGIGAMMVVPGPGLLNTLAGLATAHACNSRVLCIAGHIHSKSIGRGLGLLHELVDQTGTLKSITKSQAVAKSAAEIPELVRNAVHELRTGRPQPVSLELPHDLLASTENVTLIDAPDPQSEIDAGRQAPSAEAIAQAGAILASAKFPVIYAGGGVLASGAGAELKQLAEALQAPVVMSDNARGVLSDRHPLALNTLGGRAVFRKADVVLVAGSRFIDGMSPDPAWTSDKIKFIYLNAEPRDMGPPRTPTVAIHADSKLGLEALAKALFGIAAPARTEMMHRVREWARIQTDAFQPQSDWVRAIRANLDDDDIVVHEMTQIGYFSRLAYPVYEPGGYITPGFQGTLGFGFPTALGAAFARGGRRVVSLNGDGGFGWNLQELSTLAKYNLDVAVVVFVDGYFGNVRMIQTQLFGQSSGADLHNPDYKLLARAMGIRHVRADTPAELGEALRQAAPATGPVFIEARVFEMPAPWALFKLKAPQIGSGATNSEPPDPLPMV